MKKTNTNTLELTPEKITQTTFAFMPARVLATAVDLEVFTHIAGGNHTSEDIARASKSSHRGMEILLNSLVGLEFLTKSDSKYDLTPLSEKFLVKGQPAYYGNFVKMLYCVWEPWSHLTEIVRKGEPYLRTEKEDGATFFKKHVTILFSDSYPAARFAAEKLGVGVTWKNLNILDVATGSGAWGIAFAERDPNIRVMAQDWVDVLEVTKEFVAKFNLNKQFSYLPGDLSDVDFGEKLYDLIILGHICHSEGQEKTLTLFSRCYKSLKKNGKLLIVEFIPDDERKTAVFPLLFAVNMLVHTTEGNTFTMAEYNKWLNEAGFKDISTIQGPGPSPLIIAEK